MTSTDELRQMLDERGVKWEDMSIFPLACTSWHDHDSEPCTALEGTDDIPDGKVSVQACVTPAQAIAATLGTWTCKLPETRIDHGQIEYNGVTEWRKCSACGAEILAYPAHYCPNCGAKVVDE